MIFWDLVDEITYNAPTFEAMVCPLQRSLTLLSESQIKRFCKLYFKASFQLLTWDLFATTIIIDGGCSDDRFSDLRNNIVFCGKEIFERILEDADEIANVDKSDLFFEKLGSVPLKVYFELTGEQFKPAISHLKYELSGVSIDVENYSYLKNRFPKTWNRWWDE